MRRVLLALVASCALFACGDDDGSADAMTDVAVDTNPEDTAPDVEEDTGPPPPPPNVDPGPAPNCQVPSTFTSFAPGFAGEREENIYDFAAIAPGGPFAFTYQYVVGMLEERVERVELRMVDVAGAEIAHVELDEALGDASRVGNLRVRGESERAFLAWTRTDLDEEMQLTGSTIRHAVVAGDGITVRNPQTLFENSATRWLELSATGQLFMMRSDLDFFDDFTGVTPKLQEIAPTGDPSGMAWDLTPYIRDGAEDLHLRWGETMAAMVYRVGNDGRVSLFDTDGRPTGMTLGAENVDGVDDAAIAGGSTIFVWQNFVPGGIGIYYAVVDSEGRLRAREQIDMVVGGTSVAVVATWPGFAVVWRESSDETAMLRGAGVGVDGRLLVDPQDLLAVPNAKGNLILRSDLEGIALATRIKDGGVTSLGFGRVCPPR